MTSRASALPRSGIALGGVLAPLTAFGSYVRKSRVFHPRGVVLSGVAIPVDEPSRHHEAGVRLRGPVLARFSSAWWKTKQWPDVLGCALRFSGRGDMRDQDLLLATVRHPMTTLLAPLSTHVNDFLGNAYFGVSPFVVPPFDRVKLRLVPLASTPAIGDRLSRLVEGLARGPLRLQLELRGTRLGARYEPIAIIELRAIIAVDQEQLTFDPFKHGRGFQPVGFVHALRRATYAASRWARGAEAADPRRSRASFAPVPPRPAANENRRAQSRAVN